MKNNKLKYVTPRVDNFVVDLEPGVANSSASVSGGKPGTEYTPEVESWKTGSSGGEGYSKGDI